MKNLNLIIDFNNLAFRALFTCSYANPNSVSTFDTEEEIGIFIRKLSMDIAYTMRLFMPNKTIIACDSKYPWRNSYFKNIDNGGYKGTRTKDETKNWDKIFAAMNDLKEILKNKGFSLYEIDSAEADDIASMLKTRFFNKKENVVLVSSDKDWTQLVDFNTEMSLFCICFNPIISGKNGKKLYLTEKCMNWLQETDVYDIFFTDFDTAKDNIKNITSRDSKVIFEVINPSDILMDKIMCGDMSDNVPGFYDFYKNGKMIHITKLRAEKILKESNVTDLESLIKTCSDSKFLPFIEKVLNTEIHDMNESERLDRQRHLVELNESLFPQKIVGLFEDKFNNDNTGYVDSVSVKMEDLLKDTKYINENYVKGTRLNSIFTDITDLEKFLKPII